MVDLDQIRRWLDLAYPVSPDRDERYHVGEIDQHGKWSGRAYPRNQVAAAVAAAEMAAAPVGVYLGACTYRPDAGNGRKAADTAWCYGMWSDLDIAGPGHKHDPAKYDGLTLPPDETSARAIVAASGLPTPSVWIHSGGGLYAWWLLDAPVSAGECGDLARRWQATLARTAKLFGWHYGTGVSDLTRVLRLPGTINRKVPGAPVPARILSADGPRYRIDQLHAAAPEPTPQPPTKPTPPTAGTGALDLFLAPAPNGGTFDAFAQSVTWAQLLEPHDWTHAYRHDDGYDVWTRPGKQEGVSATTGYTPAGTMKCFSDNAGLPTEGTLTKAFVWAALTQGTAAPDMTLAAAQLGQAGYGKAGEAAADAAMAFEANGLQPPAAATSARALRVTRASEITMRAVRWLWQEIGTVETLMAPGGGAAQWLPLGGLCLLGGREGTGKTTWTYRIVAQVTAGTLPGAFLGQPKSAIIAATEDDWERTIVPRLVAVGADLDRVLRVDAEEGGIVAGLTLPADIPALHRLCGAEDAALVVLDPLMGAISGVLDTHKDAEVRRALEPLSRLAHDAQLTIVGLIHVNKSQGNDLLTRLMASRAFSAVARAVLFAAAEDPEPGAEAKQETFLFGQAKNNLAARVPHSLRYHIEAVKVGRDDELGVDIWSSRVVVDKTVGGRIDELMSAQESRAPERETVRDRACKWLREYLTKNGPIASSVVKRAAKEAGFSEATVKRASQDIEVTTTYVPGSNSTAWMISDPASDSEPVELVEPVELLEPVELVVQTTSKVGATAPPAQPAQAQATGRPEPVSEPECSPRVFAPLLPTHPAPSAPTVCQGCGGPIFLQRPGRNTCARCEHAAKETAA